ncbi:MAG TPA: alpha-amylase family protein [Verrucomicrobiae bacterium]|nr:alpha-amylase family protein [Verrucomicrobiae bacterium]
MLRSTRREFLKQTALASTAVAAVPLMSVGAENTARRASNAVPWYRWTLRWGQTNITEIDPGQYDVAWWREYWKRTETQGAIINAGGIVAYYPSDIPFHHRAERLNGRDLFGELCKAAHEDGLAVFARMDSSRAYEDLYQAHPDWFARRNDGQPYKSEECFITCINSPYYEEHIPAIMREIVERYHPEGFTDNSWAGLGRSSPCFCDNCQKRFQKRTGHEIPREKNWSDALYREWIQWNYERRVEMWELNNQVTKAAGGADCIWVGMNSGSISGQCQSFRDFRQICRRAEMIMLDHQARTDSDGFQQNGEAGKLIHGLLGWDKLIPESMAMYQAGKPVFRYASKPEPEVRLWMVDGIAGGLQPWWHNVGAYHEDRRRYETPVPVLRWHRGNEKYLVNRTPVATVGVVWSQRNMDFYGRDDAGVLVELPWRGMTQALVRARIPYLPVHADDLERDATQFTTLVLPNLAAMSDAQVAAVRRFVERGGGLLATGQSTLFSENGEARADFALADLFVAHVMASRARDEEATRRKWATETAHSYLRLTPELRSQVDGPHIQGEPKISGERHPVLRGFEETDILAFGGILEQLKLDAGAQALLTFIPPFPAFPPETSWMREPKTEIPGLVLNSTANGSRVAFLPADLDRRFGRDNLPDHGDLLANLVRWTAGDQLPLSVEGAGLIDCHLYTQPGRMILHLINLTNAGTWRAPVGELIRAGPFRVRVKLAAGAHGRNVKLLVGSKNISARVKNGWSEFEVGSILDHEVAVVEG